MVRLVSALLVGCVLATLGLAGLLAMMPLPPDTCSCNSISSEDRYVKSLPDTDSEHKLAIIVPFRDRFDELLEFAPHISKFLNRQNIIFHIFVINQIDRHRFNRASLINVGFLRAKDEYDYIAMHDVDLLPLNPKLTYNYPEEGPFHVASPEFHPKYNYSTFVGGILLINRDHFTLVNGMSNKYWGWGLEDDEFYVRLKEAKLKVTRPSNIKTNKTNTFSHIHDRVHRKRDTMKCFNQYESTRRRDRQTGLHNIEYEKTNEHILTIDNVAVTVLNVKLTCDKTLTPWCDCSQQDVKNVKRTNSRKS